MLIILAIAFGVLLGRNQNAGAVIEWIIAFLFTFYLLSFWHDLHQSRNFSKGELTRERFMTANGVGRENVNGHGNPDVNMAERGSQM